MSEHCEWLHEQLELLPLVRFPFDEKDLPSNGIYFLYEEGEIWGHGGNRPRIVSIGTHHDGNFRNRIAEHFLLDERKMLFDNSHLAPHNRSILRKHIGRALLNKTQDTYLSIWNKDFILYKNREKYGNLLDIQKEKHLEEQVTEILRNHFSFRFIMIEKHDDRVGDTGLQNTLSGR